MKRFRIEFTHVEASKYYAVIEANSKSEALEICKESPFDYSEDNEPHDVNGIDFEINKDNVEELKL